MIDARHVEWFEAQEKTCMDDVYGSGEALFARKFSDASLSLLDRIDAMIQRKQSRDPVASL